MEEQLINKKTAKLATSKGFNLSQKIITSFIDESEEYESEQTGITQSLLKRWLIEEYNCIVDVYWNRIERESLHFEWYSTIDYHGKNMENKITEDADFVSDIYTSYEEALEIALYEALKLIKTK